MYSNTMQVESDGKAQYVSIHSSNPEVYAPLHRWKVSNNIVYVSVFIQHYDVMYA